MFQPLTLRVREADSVTALIQANMVAFEKIAATQERGVVQKDVDSCRMHAIQYRAAVDVLADLLSLLDASS